MLLTAIAMLFRDSLLDLIARRTDGLSDGRTRLLTTLLGAFLGVLVSISSVGAGAIGMPVLLALYPRLPTVRLVGSDIAHAVHASRRRFPNSKRSRDYLTRFAHFAGRSGRRIPCVL